MLSAEFNRRILSLAPKHSVSDLAPSSFEELKANVGRLVVWAGASDKTIYGDPAINWAFRAWHDSLHLKLSAPFNLEGELHVANEQARIIGCDSMGKIILAEVAGQAEYYAANGVFPSDQVSFIESYLKRA